MQKDKTCASGSFVSLNVSQFFGAFNDNAFKVMASLMALRLVGSGGDGAMLMSVAGALFTVPFILFSPYAGFCADRFSKRSVMLAVKWFELVIMSVGVAALFTKSIPMMFAVLFLLAVHSVFFSPSKYGILPEILDDKELSRGNGFIELWTFIGIIAGTAAGGKLLSIFVGREWVSCTVLFALACVGLCFSTRVAKTPAAAPQRQFEKNPFATVIRSFSEIGKNRALFSAMCGLGFFWFLGAIFQMNVMLFGKQALGLDDAQTSLLLVAVSLGIAAGSVAAGRVSEGKVEIGLVPLGAVGMSACSLAIGWTTPHFGAAMVLLALLGFSAGIYVVPLNAFFQQQSPSDKRGAFQGASSVFANILVLTASGFMVLAAKVLALSAAQVFAVVGIFAAVAAVAIVFAMPEALARLVNWVLAHSLYRIRVVGGEQVPQTGGALLVCNHVSFVDAIVVMASLKRPVRFVMFAGIYNLPIVNLFCKAARVIPIDGRKAKATLAALETARDAIASGELVCIFPEGKLTCTGNLLPFQKGFEKIMEGRSEPIIPLYLDNIWGSVFSFAQGKFFWKMPQKTPYPLTVIVGAALPADAKAWQVRSAVQELGAEACIYRGGARKKLHVAFIDEVKKRPFKLCTADSTGLSLSYAKMLTMMFILSEKLFPASRRPLETNEMVGVLLPASCMAAAANGAIFCAGKVPVNLNFTHSVETLNACVAQCGMRMIVTSRAFIEKLGMPPRSEMVFLEDLKEMIGGAERLLTFSAVLVLPAALLRARYVKGDTANVDDVATVIFSSGSTGEPKGVMLTHGNIFSNIEGFYQVFDVKPNDVILGALPFFHSFGFTATMCFPIGTGLTAIYHNNPMDAAVIGKLAKKYRATVLMGTPTFLSAYLRKCTPDQFASLRLAITGAEKLKEQLASAFAEKFGVVPFEGYGATELSPIVSVGYPDFVSEAMKETQKGNKAGTVGHPIPGVAVKVVDPDTGVTLSYGMPGLLMVKGPNVMKGYLNNPAKTAEVIKDGWYVTGDIATVDDDGFVKITDRLSRFSKIGGEMVPHVKIEEAIHQIIGATETICAVTSVADEKKGERLVVLHAHELDVETIWDGLSKHGLPNLWIPKKDAFFKVDAIPVLGTGKTDLKKVKETARALAEAQPALEGA